MRKNMKRIAAVLSAAALAVFTPLNGIMPDSLSVTASAETYTISVGDEFLTGDNISFGNGAYVDPGHSGSMLIEGGVKLTYDKFVSDKETGDKSSYHLFYLTGGSTPDENSSVMIKETRSTVPVGIRVTGGTGTENDPFTFECVYRLYRTKIVRRLRSQIFCQIG